MATDNDEGAASPHPLTLSPPHSFIRTGRVSLVGAGPGDPGLLTLRGREALAAADVVVYDRLANPRLLRHAREGSERINVGKQPGDRTWRQSQINALLVERARSGQVVCRLKGGDPFVYGRGGEEAVALAEAGVPFEVVPGVSSAVAAPAYAGIPVTYRGICSALGVIAGHGDPGGHAETLRYAELARGLDTLVFLMGVENLPNIVDGLIAGGRDPETPVALIRWGTWPVQETLVGSLRSIVNQVQAAGFRAPAVTVIGEVVRLREKIRWYDNRPLFGRRILVTRARDQAGELCQRLEEAGAEPVEVPLIRLEPIDAVVFPAPLDAYDWVLFASANAVSCFWRALSHSGCDWRALGGARIGAVGPATARALEAHHLRPDFVPGRYEASELVTAFPDSPAGQRILLPRAAEAPPVLSEGLLAAGANVDSVAVYRNVIAETETVEIERQISKGELDAVTFTSASTVRRFRQRWPNLDLDDCVVACIGPSTAAAAREMGLLVTVVAEPHTSEGLVQALRAVFAGEPGVRHPDV